MSRCKACNQKLKDNELRTKVYYKNGTWEFVDLCTKCMLNEDMTIYRIRDPTSEDVDMIWDE